MCRIILLIIFSVCSYAHTLFDNIEYMPLHERQSCFAKMREICSFCTNSYELNSGSDELARTVIEETIKIEKELERTQPCCSRSMLMFNFYDLLASEVYSSKSKVMAFTSHIEIAIRFFDFRCYKEEMLSNDSNKSKCYRDIYTYGKMLIDEIIENKYLGSEVDFDYSLLVLGVEAARHNIENDNHKPKPKCAIL